MATRRKREALHLRYVAREGARESGLSLAVLVRVPVTLTDEHKAAMFDMIRRLSDFNAPLQKTPIRDECQFCNIGKTDCAQRVMPAKTVSVGDF